MKKLFVITILMVGLYGIVSVSSPIIPASISQYTIINGFPYRATWSQLYYKPSSIMTNGGEIEPDLIQLSGVNFWNVEFVGNFALKTNNLVYINGVLVDADPLTFRSLAMREYGTENYGKRLESSGAVVGSIYYDKDNLYIGTESFELGGSDPLEKYYEVVDIIRNKE